MPIQQTHNDRLYKACALFLESMRPYIVDLLSKEAGDRWPAWYVECLSPSQKEQWNDALRSGSQPENMIDYPHLKSFAIRYKDLLRKDFGKEVGSLPTRFDIVYGTRNKMAHYEEISKDAFTEAILNMKSISRALGMVALEEALEKLQEGQVEEPAVPVAATGTGLLPPWFLVVDPHFDIKQGRLDESVFAADLSEVSQGSGPEIYNNPGMFFSKTYFTAGFRNVARAVIGGLNGQVDAENRVISLQTGFGGGKTHTLISLYHLANAGKNAKESGYLQELLNYTGQPNFEPARIAVFTNKTNDPANGRKPEEGVHIQTIWGELAYQLGGRQAYELVRKNDEQLIAPAGIFKQVLAQCKPALILIDELADYCVKASARMAGNSSLTDQTISFMQEFTEAVAATDQCVAVITLPASVQEVGNTPQAQAILNALQKRVSRIGADTLPVADEEIFEVIRRRLFDQIGNTQAIEKVVSSYMELYNQFTAELPVGCNKSEYKQKLLKSYPFHPELIDVFRVRWASHHDFQRTRGVLRLLAAIVSDLWKRRQSLPGENAMIHPGMVNFAQLDALTGQLKKLYGNGYDSVITADVAGSSSNAFKIDGTKGEYGQLSLTQSIASVILMHSFGSEGPNKGISIPELKLCLLTPNGFNHNSINGALDELENHAYYLYYAQSTIPGKRYWFHTKPNINILINQAKGDIGTDDIRAEVIHRLQQLNKEIGLFKVIIAPEENQPEHQKFTLVILGPEHTANPTRVNGNTLPYIEKMATKKGNTERVFRNTMLFLVCSELVYGKLAADVQEFLACKKISTEYNSQLEAEQKADLRKRSEEASWNADKSLVVAYSILVKYSAKKGAEILPIKTFKESLRAQIGTYLMELLKEEEWLLASVGLGTLRAHNLLPSIEAPIRVKDVYEAFLRYDDKPMVINEKSVADSLLRYCQNGEFCIASGDGKNFTRFYFQENVPYFEISDTTYWLVEKTTRPIITNPEPILDIPVQGDGNPLPKVNEPIHGGVAKPATAEGPVTKSFKSIRISGSVPIEQYTQIFSSFINPLKGNQIEIEISIKAWSTADKKLTETTPEYLVAKESARQLRLSFEEDE